MGNVRSGEANTNSNAFSDDPFWNPQSAPTITRENMSNNQSETPGTSSNEREEHREQLQRNLEEFKLELERKHEKRRELIAEKRREFQQVKDELQALKEENEMLKSQKSQVPNPIASSPDLKLQGKIENLMEENEELKLQVEKLKILLKNGEEVNTKNRELRITVSEMQLDVQKLNSEMLNIEQERLEYSKHITALKDVVNVTKNMLEIREAQIEGLKEKVKTVEELLASKEMKIMSDGLREEYEKQLRNIRNLRTLYEERQRLDKIDKEHLQVQLEECKKQVENEQTISSDRLARIEELEKDNSTKYDQITGLQSTLGLTKAECTELQAEIDVINQLFSQILRGFNNSPEIDFDKLRSVLEENHDLLTDIASNEESHSTAAALPKVLLDLINQINNEKQTDTKSDIDEQCMANALHQLNSPAEIVENLPKVWKVLIELLSHQNPPLSALKEGEKDPCYKSVETPTGPKLKLSVSQTFIRLKDLIIEKKFLEREMYRLKHLNTHLEGRLQDQEKRLELVSGELTTTWHVVEKMQKQHHQLHTHEKVLRYELHEKRKLLTELKQELQYCRDKWGQARAKNDSTQEQWKELRKEFAARKTSADDFNQSAESGYSDDKDSSEDEKGYESDVSDGKRESDCDDLDNAPLATIQATCQRDDESCEQFDERNEHNEMEIGEEHHECEPNVDPLNADDNASALQDMNTEYPEDKIATNIRPEDNNVSSPEVSTTVSPTISPSTSTGAIRKVPKQTKNCTNDKTTEQRLEVDIDKEITKETDSLSESLISNLSLNEQKVENNSVAETTALSASAPPSSVNKSNRTPEEILAAREERLQRLERESNELFQKVTHTKLRGSNISDRLDNLHEIYGESSSASKEDEVQPVSSELEESSNTESKDASKEETDNNNES